MASALSALARLDSGRVLALLAGYFGDLDLADESVQDALAEAAATWLDRGIPDNPAGWLLTVGRNKGIDRLRRESSARRRTLAAAPELAAGPDTEAAEESALIVDDAHIADEQLRLMLLCCHPALDTQAQVALTLRLVGGVTTGEIAAAFLLPEATLAQRLVRAKRKIRDAGIPLSIPTALDSRVDALLGVLYLIFNEGYLSSNGRTGAIRVDLVGEAIRLTELASAVLPKSAEALGLLALELFHRARLDTRVDGVGDLILLPDQDRSRWDLAGIERANTVLTAAMAAMQPGPYQLQAIIAGYHANARVAADTDWAAVAGLYRQLAAMTPSPIIRLNSAVAVAMADGPLAGLGMLAELSGLDSYHLFHAAVGELQLRAGNPAAAAVAFDRAEQLTENPAEQRHLTRRRAACDPPG